jgi:hypothetical protein
LEPRSPAGGSGRAGPVPVVSPQPTKATLASPIKGVRSGLKPVVPPRSLLELRRAAMIIIEVTGDVPPAAGGELDDQFTRSDTRWDVVASPDGAPVIQAAQRKANDEGDPSPTTMPSNAITAPAAGYGPGEFDFCASVRL